MRQKKVKENEGKGATKLSEETVQLFSNVAGLNTYCFFFTSKGRRDNSRKVVFLFTDGQWNEFPHLTIPKANALKAIGVDIYVVAVGRYISGIDEMVKVSSSPPENYVFRVEKNSALWKVVKLVIKQVNPGKYPVLNGQYDPPCS